MSNHEEVSKVTAIKDQAVGAVKQAIGNVLGNNKMELQGKAQKVHGKNEYEYAKAAKAGESEPESFQQAYESHDNTAEQGPIQTQHQESFTDPAAPPIPAPAPAPAPIGVQASHPSEDINPTAAPTAQPIPPPLAGEAPPPPLENINPAPIVGQAPPLSATAQPIPPAPPAEGSHEIGAEGKVEESNISTLGALKDQALGSVKDKFGSITGNQDMELQGKAQNIHGKNEAEFAKAQKQGLNEPEHFAQGTKINDQPQSQGQVEGDKVSSFSAMKDQAVGSIKSTYGTAVGDTDTELAGKAQNIHGRNESEFVKAQKQGLDEPEHFAQGTKVTDQTENNQINA